MTKLIKEYLNFKSTEWLMLWEASDELYAKIMQKNKAFLNRMSNTEIQYLIDHSQGKERYSYKLILEKRTRRITPAYDDRAMASG